MQMVSMFCLKIESAIMLGFVDPVIYVFIGEIILPSN